MVKPPLRTKSIGFKVSEEEYAQLETAAQASGRTLGEWCRETILRGVTFPSYPPCHPIPVPPASHNPRNLHMFIK